MNYKPGTLGVEEGEYIITADSGTAIDYEVYYKGKKINDAVAIVRRLI